MVTPPRWLRAIAATAATTLVASSLILLPAVTAQADDASVNLASSTSLPTAQVNGVVWAQVVIGSTVYVGGSFTTAQPAGAAAGVGTVARSNMLAYDLTSGKLIDSFAPTFNAEVRGLAASPDGTRLYAVGSFTTVNGATRNRLVALDPSTGAIVTAFKPTVNAQVLAVTATADAVYFGGGFTGVDGATRTRAAAVKASDGSILPWAPAVPDHSVRALVLSPDASKVVLAGSFLSLNGSTTPGRGSGMVDASTGTTDLPWALGSLVYDAGDHSALWSLSTDGTDIYGTGYVYGDTKTDGNLEGAFNVSWDGGTINWIEDCHGDSYGVSAMQGAVYVAGHPHECVTVGGHPQTTPDWTFQRAVAFSRATTGTLGHNPISGYYDFYGQPAPSMLGFYPDLVAGTFTGQGQAAWSVTTAKGYVLLGGEFPTVNGARQTGLARFATRDVVKDTDGPQLTAGKFVPNVVSNSAGTATVSWRANYDRGDAGLTYEVYRNGNKTTPIYSTTATSKIFFDRPTLQFTDSGLTPGATYSYRLRAVDPSGNEAWGNSVSVTVATSTVPISAYDSAITADGANHYWRLSDPAGSTSAFDSAGADNLVLQSGVQLGTTGSGTSGTAATFSGDATGFGSTTTLERAPNTFSVEAWFRTTSTSGGKIVGYGDNKGTTANRSVTSSNYDRSIYMDGSGSVSFGVYDGSTETISTGSGLNDGRWHYAVGVLGASGERFYVDGKLVGTRSTVTSGQDYYGYWRVGGDSSWAGDDWFDGDVDDVATYGTALGTGTVKQHWALSGSSAVVPAPTDAYGAAVYNDFPSTYWRLDDAAGSTAAQDASGNGATASYTGGVKLGVPGVLPGADTAAVFNGSDGALTADAPVTDPETYSLELWFSTTSTTGGKLIGFGDARTGSSSSYDRHIWMHDDGTLSFGTYTGQTNIITTSRSYNDGTWHQVVATQGADGLKLYVDGALAGTNPTTSAQSYTGYWRLGGDNLGGWPTGATSSSFAGTLDEVAIYPSVLSPSDVSGHYAIGAGKPDQPPTASITASVADLAVAFDGTGSTDPDGTVASYAWDFGDGSTGTGSTAKHTYASAGAYTARLTVTDDQGATGTVTQQVVVTAANVPPTASFASSASGLTASFDASASKDSDGSISSYEWDFGDGGTGSQQTAAHTYASSGTYTVKLTVTDDRGAAVSITHPVQVQAVDAPPVASFTTTVTGSSVAFDASASTDPDGSVAAYAWDFGDGAKATGVGPAHVYAAGGTYTVRLTVTDDLGATSSITHAVTVAPAAPVSTTVAQDSFGRTLTGRLGSADIGGAWTTTTPASSYAVNGSAAVFTTAPGKTLAATLGSVSASDVDVQAVFGLPASPSSGSTYLMLGGRTIGSAAYTVRATVSSAGVVNLYLLDGTKVLGTTKVSGLTAASGDRLHLRLALTGTSPTTVAGKVWKDGIAEPSAWQLTTSDSDSALQKPGGVGVSTYVSGSATASAAITVDDLVATTGAAVPPKANVAPTASFTASAAALTASFDASASSDSDGTISSYAWDFGDGTTGTGSTTQHTYTSAGDHTVVLTVKDDGGATASSSRTVTTAAASPLIAQDSFGRTVASGFGTAGTGGSWTLTGGAANFAVGGGVGSMSIVPGKTLTALLGSVSAAATDTTATFGASALPSTGSLYYRLIGRQVGSASYSARAVVTSTGAVSLYAVNGDTVLQGVKVSGLTIAAGDLLHVRVRVTGTSPTTVQARIWKDGVVEPTTWQLTTTDSTAALQAPGSAGVGGYLSSSATNGPIRISVDELSVAAV